MRPIGNTNVSSKRGFEQDKCSFDVRADELGWAVNRPIDVTFSGEMHNVRWAKTSERFCHPRTVFRWIPNSRATSATS